MTLEPTTKTLVEVSAYLDELLKVVGGQQDGDGLVLIGRPAVGKVGLAVNCSWQAIESAGQRGCDLLVVHHGLWPWAHVELVEKKQARLAELGISLYVAHDCLDAARDLGTGDALARAVRVAVQGSLMPEGEPEIGVHGVTTGHFSEFVVRVGTSLGVDPRAWKNVDSFGHVGIAPGWGGRPEWIAHARSLGCDTVLTGESNMFGLLYAREAGVNLVVAGHYATETPGVMALSSRLARDLGCDVTFIPEEIVEERG